MKPMSVFIIFLFIIFAVVMPAFATDVEEAHTWSDNEVAAIGSLWLGNLPPPPLDPSNAFSGNPRAAALGKKFFFDSRFSRDGSVSCSTCHRPDMQFTDSLPFSHGIAFTSRRSMPLIGMAYQSWFFWDGRVDSLWAQALEPPETPEEHGISRTMAALIIGKYYRDEYEAVFGPMPVFTEEEYPAIARPDPEDPLAYQAWQDMDLGKRTIVNRVFVNFGKVIAAYVRLIVPSSSRFDRYIEALVRGDRQSMHRTFSVDEAIGLRLFVGKAKCMNCHHGPLLTNGDFHNLDIPRPEGAPMDRGRADGIRQVYRNLFNCMGKFSDADAEMDCDELRYMDTDTTKYIGAFKTPTLRNVADRPPYMHAGQFSTLREVLEFYAASDNPELGHGGGLSQKDIRHLEAFLMTLSGPLLEYKAGNE